MLQESVGSVSWCLLFSSVPSISAALCTISQRITRRSGPADMWSRTICHVACQTHHWAPGHRYSLHHNPSFLWTCEVFGFSLRADVCRASFETCPLLFAKMGLRDIHPAARTVSAEMGEIQWKTTVEWVSGWEGGGSWNTGASQGKLDGWKLNISEGCLVICWPDYVSNQERRRKLKLCTHDLSWIQTDSSVWIQKQEIHWMVWWFIFPSAGLPYGWEEAYTADGVKYYIK